MNKVLKEESQFIKTCKCNPAGVRKNGKDALGNQRYQCTICKHAVKEVDPNFYLMLKDTRMILHLLLLGFSEGEVAKEFKKRIAEVSAIKNKFLSKIDQLKHETKSLKIYIAKDYLSSLDSGKRPERLNKNNNRLGPFPKKSTRKK